MRLRRLALLALALIPGGCADDSATGGPDPLPSTRLVTVTVEYRQPNGCLNPTGRCNDRVVFFGSWMHGQDSVLLTQTTGSFTWTGRATDVPVNFPPRDQPYLVRVFDPHLVGTETGGVTASRLVVGGQLVTYFDLPGTSSESGVIYIDDNGSGRNPF